MNVKTQSWPEIHRYYDDLLNRYKVQVGPILRLIEWIKSEDLESVLFPSTSMHDLVLSDQADFKSGENTLCISCVFHTQKVKFGYSRLFASSDYETKEVSDTEAQETLRQFLAYKFGIYRKPECNKSVV